MVKILGNLFFLLCLPFAIIASEFVDFNESRNNKNITFLLSTPKSGTNLITGCLSAITRRPISWFYWGDSIGNPSSNYRQHISYNRLGLPLISDIPLLYRSHYEFAKLMQVPFELNKLIFATRNPKELIYRSFFLQASQSDEEPNDQFIEEFLNWYLQAFEVYEAWCPSTRRIVFYEDFIINDESILLELLRFMDEEPLFFEDFLNNKQEYLSRLLLSYADQHKHNLGGSSSKEGPKPIYYTKNASPERLRFIEGFFLKNAPEIWEKYLKRFETVE